MAQPMTTDELSALFASFTQPSALIELGTTAGCLAVAWGVVRLLRGRATNGRSVWFGERIVDGALFPMLALALALGARLALESLIPIAVVRIVITVMLAFVVIRLSVR